MDKITVAELASECSVQNQVVLSELKRLGLYVYSSSAPIDATFADTIRKKIFAQREAEEAKIVEAEKKKEAQAEAAKLAAKKTAKKSAKAAPEEAPEEAAALTRPKHPAKKAEKAHEVKKEEEPAARLSLAPRKGRKHFDRGTAELVEVTVLHPPKEPELTNLEAAQKLLAGIGVPAEAPPQEPAQEAPGAEPVQAEPAHELSAAPAPPVEQPAALPEPAPRHEEPVPHPGTVARKIIVPKTKTKILMRTSTEKVVTPDITDRILKGLQERAPAPRPVAPTRF